jgi:hypothetical protein
MAGSRTASSDAFVTGEHLTNPARWTDGTS